MVTIRNVDIVRDTAALPRPVPDGVGGRGGDVEGLFSTWCGNVGNHAHTLGPSEAHRVCLVTWDRIRCTLLMYSTVIRCYFLVTQGVIVVIQSIVEGFKVACLLHVVLDTPLRYARVIS